MSTCADESGPEAVCRWFSHHSMPLLQDPWRSGSGPNSPFAGGAALLQLRLLQAYLLLPKAGAFVPEHASLLRLCASALKGTSAPSGTTDALHHMQLGWMSCHAAYPLSCLFWVVS